MAKLENKKLKGEMETAAANQIDPLLSIEDQNHQVLDSLPPEQEIQPNASNQKNSLDEQIADILSDDAQIKSQRLSKTSIDLDLVENKDENP